jgi:hypothetical protein
LNLDFIFVSEMTYKFNLNHNSDLSIANKFDIDLILTWTAILTEFNFDFNFSFDFNFDLDFNLDFGLTFDLILNFQSNLTWLTCILTSTLALKRLMVLP